MAAVAQCFVDSPASHVDDAIDGLLMANPQLVELDGRHTHTIRVIMRRDWDRDTTSHVALISGGGSGHEPAHAGFVGSGMLTAAVCGDVFASPSVKAVLAAIVGTSRPGGPGALLIVKNYTGDRLNFGLAAEQARALGVKVELVFVGDDAAVHGGPITGRRGLAGTLLVHKCAGAAASAGATLDEVVEAASAAAGAVRTVGASLTTCSVPGQVPSGRLDAAGMVEVGLGIHGEPGLAQIALPPATQLVELMVGILWGGESDAQGLLRVSVGEGGGGKGKGVSVGLTSPMPPLRVAPVAKSAAAAGDEALECVLVVNNLGGCSGLEMGVLAKAAAAAISSRGATVSRLLVGSMMTALDMKGFSLTILPLHAASALCPLIDAATSAPGWLAIALSPELTARPANPSDRLAPVPLAPELRSAVRSGGVAVKRFGAAADGSSPSGGEATVTALLAVAAAVKAAEPLLTALDTLSGDGDCGLTAHKGAMAIEAVALASALAAGYDASSIATMRESASRAGEMTMLELSQQFDPSSGKEAAASEAAPASASGATAASEAADTMASTAAGGSDVSGLAAGTVAVCALDDASAVLAACAEAVAASMGGSSGVLYAIMLSAASRAAAASADTGTAAAVVLAAALAAGATAVSELGGATQGCSTMVDALAPAATAATSAARSSGAPVSVRAVAVAAADAALDGAKATAGMRAMAGRASYSQADETLAAVADPGAVTVAVWLSVLQRICGLGEHE